MSNQQDSKESPIHFIRAVEKMGTLVILRGYTWAIRIDCDSAVNLA